MADKDLKLTSLEMAQFVRDGFLRFDNLVPRELCDAAHKEMIDGVHSGYKKVAAPFSEVWPTEAVGQAFRLPKVEAIIHSLIGPNPRYDHHAAHLTPANTRKGANLHQDAEYDIRELHFDIQISFFPADTPLESGGTLFVPGSHFRRVHEADIKRYQNIVGQVQAVCEAGTMFFWHANTWHSARSNTTNQDRYMFKLRLNPTVRQQRLWNTDDIESPEIPKILSQSIPWHGQRNRIEIMNRIKLWRFLSGDNDFDTGSLWWTRVENEPDIIHREQRVSI